MFGKITYKFSWRLALLLALQNTFCIRESNNNNNIYNNDNDNDSK